MQRACEHCVYVMLEEGALLHKHCYFTLLKGIAFEPLIVLSNLHASLLGRFKMNVAL